MIFDTISTGAAEASLDALWMKTQVISDNLANADTPGYKAKSVSFSQVLNKATQSQGSTGNVQAQPDAQNPQQNVQQSTGSAGGSAYRTKVSTQTGTEVRVDGNNVQLEKEQTDLWKSYAQYSYLLDRISGHYGSINTAVSNMRT